MDKGGRTIQHVGPTPLLPRRGGGKGAQSAGLPGFLVSLTILGYNGCDGGMAMRERLITLAAILVAVVGWWGLYELTGRMTPDRPGALALFLPSCFWR